jgi:hypothetical protein
MLTVRGARERAVSSCARPTPFGSAASARREDRATSVAGERAEAPCSRELDEAAMQRAPRPMTSHASGAGTSPSTGFFSWYPGELGWWLAQPPQPALTGSLRTSPE